MINAISDRMQKNILALILCFIALITSIIILFISVPATAEMNILDDNELSEVTATGFSKFTLTNGLTDIARVDLDLSAATYAEMGAMKMGYHGNGVPLGWDQDWQSVSFGSDDQDLVLKDFVFEAEFQNISDSANRQLQGITIGFTDVTGTITSDFGSFSGSIQGVDYQRELLGLTSVTLANEPFLLKLQIDSGVSFQIGW